MRYIFVVNPVAGKGNLQEKIINSINTYFKDKSLDYDVYITKSKGDAERYVRVLANTGENLNIYACGGEGTFYEVLNGAIDHDNINLGVVPCGSANDFLKYFKKTALFSDIAAQIDGNIIKIDAIKAGERYCINGCSAGMDAIVARDMSIFKNMPLVSGKMAYNLAIVKTFLKKIGVSISISVDGAKPKIADCLFAVIANAPYYGGGYMAAPDAVPNDNKLNFTLVDSISKSRVLGFLQKYKKGEIKALEFCHLKTCENMSFSAKVPIPVNLDGEIIEARSMDFSIVKNAVNFIIPNSVKL